MMHGVTNWASWLHWVHSRLQRFLPQKHVYMAVGYHGQVILVFPGLDVVAVTTGRGNYPLSELADSISSSVKSDTALPTDAAGAKLLAAKIRDVATEKPTAVGPTPKLAATISGKVYRFAPNELKLKSLSLNLADPQPHYELEFYGDDTDLPMGRQDSHRFSGPIGLDGVHRTGKPTYLQGLGVSGVYALKASWRDDSTFVIDRLLLGFGQPAEHWLLTFNGEKLNVSLKLLNGEEVSVGGSTGE